MYRKEIAKEDEMTKCEEGTTLVWPKECDWLLHSGLAVLEAGIQPWTPFALIHPGAIRPP